MSDTLTQQIQVEEQTSIPQTNDSATPIEVMDESMTLPELLQRTEELQRAGRLVEASNLYQVWIEHTHSKEKHIGIFNHGALLQAHGQIKEAERQYSYCIELNPNFPQAYINLGLIQEQQGQHTSALKTWLSLVRQITTTSPTTKIYLITALNHIGRVQEDLKNYQQALYAFEKSLDVDPKQLNVIQHWIHIRQKACCWPIYKALPGINYAQMKLATSPLAMLALTTEPSEQLLHASAHVARTYKIPQQHLSQGKKYQHTKIRIGYLSADFREHAVGFLLPVFLEAHSKELFELYAYDLTQEEDTRQRAEIKEKFYQIRPISHLNDQQAAELILKDEIDILIDLHGLSAGGRPGIFALRPAPKQGTYLGFIGTTGMPWLDFVIADKTSIPPENSKYFSEKVVYLNDTFIPLTNKKYTIEEKTREQLKIPNAAFLMAAFSNTYKITEEMFEVWQKILLRIPSSMLWLIDDNELCTKNLKDAVKAKGIDANRLIFTPRTTHRDFCNNLRLADIYLDTFPYNSGSTSNDVIQAGVPIVTRYGETFVSRMGFSILNSVNSEAYAVKTFEEYELKVLEVYLKTNAGHKYNNYKINWNININEIYKQLINESAETKKNYNANLDDQCIEETEIQLLEQKKQKYIFTDLDTKINIFHISYSNETKNSRPQNFLPLDNNDNKRPDWREYWPIRNYLLSRTIDNKALYGFFSPRFTEKTGLSYGDIEHFIRSTNPMVDVYIFSPFWDLNSLFRNIFIQGDYFHPGLLFATQQFADYLGLSIDLKKAVTYSKNNVFCNFIVANSKFWIQWLEIGEQLYTAAENSNNPLHDILNRDTSYGTTLLPLKIFIMERLATLLLLLNKDITSINYDIFKLGSSITPFKNHREELIFADSLKASFAESKNPIYINSFKQINSRITNLYSRGSI